MKRKKFDYHLYKGNKCCIQFNLPRQALYNFLLTKSVGGSPDIVGYKNIFLTNVLKIRLPESTLRHRHNVDSL